MKKTGSYIAIAAILIIIAIFGFLYAANYLEREKPVIKLSQEISAIGKQKKIDVSFADEKSGLSQLTAEIIQDNKSQTIITENIPARGVKSKDISLTIDTTTLKLHDGPAVINFIAKDNAFFSNVTVLSKSVNIDTVAPQITLISTINNINQGGSCVLAYRISKPVQLAGVYVDDYFSRGYLLMANNKPVAVSYFAIPMAASRTKTKITVFARDDAGNEASIIVPFLMKEKKFRADKMNLGEAFLQQKMPEFQAMTPELQGKTPLDTFIYINEKMRGDNFKKIQTVCQTSTPKQLWEGTFLRMAKAKPMALFGDRRTYMYAGKIIGQSVHEGVDLASTALAPIEASNNGLIVFAGNMGIYGNSVVIDHGLGLFSLYSHLSSINTTVGKSVKKEEVIGYSGKSGLAGGDHLHFSIIAGGRFVNPQEWWDPHWINDNVTKKMIF